MAIRKIARMGNPILRKKARKLNPEEIRSPALRQLVSDLFETMNDYEGIGLAAPQVHESIALAIVHDPDSDRPVVVINPVMTVLDETRQGYWEGCLSIPEIRGLVYRPRKIRVDYVNLEGESQSVIAEGFPATVYQHELDHLDGVLFVDRVEFKEGASPISFVDEYARYHAPSDEDEIGELDD